MDDTLILDCSSSDSKSSSSSSSNTGAIVGGVIGGLAGIVILSSIGFFALFKLSNTAKVNPIQLFQIKNVPNFFHTTESQISKIEKANVVKVENFETNVENVINNTDKVNIENESINFNSTQQESQNQAKPESTQNLDVTDDKADLIQQNTSNQTPNQSKNQQLERPKHNPNKQITEKKLEIKKKIKSLKL